MIKTITHYNRHFSASCSALLFAAIGAWSVSAAAAVEANEVAVYCGATIDGDAVMTADILSCAANPALTLHEGATLDMQGYTLMCDHGNYGIAIRLEGENELRDGNINDCPVAVTVIGEGSHYIEGINIVSPDGIETTGFGVFGGNNHFDHNTVQMNSDMSVGWHMYSSGNLITNNTVIGGGSGFMESSEVKAAGSNTYHNNSVTGANIGFDLQATDGSKLTNNQANDGVTGFLVSGGTAHELSHNTADGNSADGFVVTGDQHHLRHNTASNSDGNGIVVDSGTTNSLIEKNRIVSIGGNGIVVSAGAMGNTLDKNKARQANSGIDLVDANDNCTDNTWTKNQYYSKHPKCIQ